MLNALDLTSTRSPFRGMQCIDGSIKLGGQRQRLMPPGLVNGVGGGSGRVRITHGECRRMREKYTSPSDFLRIASVDAVREMMVWGAEHVEQMDADGALDPLDEYRLPRV